ncbi:MAG TPA: hypothetical protein VK431_01400 [Nitrosopumilaceae archaeon]|nr:hypothetical protein [Nitrosopumilaceae archaeon]
MKTKIIISCILILGLLSTPAFALNHPGIKWEWKIKAADHTYIVTTVSNYDMQNVTLNSVNKELIFTGNSTYTDNIAEIEIPHNLIGGSLTVTQNGKQISPIIINGTDSSTIMLKFNQTGITTTNVLGTTYLPEFGGISTLVMVISIGMVIFTLKTRNL